MCGFVGMIRWDGAQADRAVIEGMSAAIFHRGPDSHGTYISGPVGLASRRLSILDSSAMGLQPMVSSDDQVVLVFNGEIYNYVELREQLQALGHVFKSTGDTEVLLHAYLEWGRECLNKLNGMWAFLIYDIRRRKIFGSRDRFGKKPLYYYRGRDAVFFGSEIKSILASGAYIGGPNWGKISELLLGKFGDLKEGEHSFYAKIDQLSPGYAFELDLEGRFNRWCFWSLANVQQSTTMSQTDDPPRSFYETFESACFLRLRSDVPIGILLSGGIDSTSILCCIANMRDRDLAPNSFSVFSYQAKEYDESNYINDSVRQTGVTLIPYRPEPERMWDSLEEMLWYQDEPVNSMSAVITFELYRIASQRGVKVVLHGGGPDEFLAGYPNFFLNYWCTLLKAGRTREAWREIVAYCAVRGGHPWSLFQNSLRHLTQSELYRVRAYGEIARRKRCREFQKNSWFTEELVGYLPNERQEYLGPSLDSALRRAMTQAPLPTYLRVDDRNSMAHSVEARAPFLDYRLVALAFQQPARWKMRGPLTKYLLREAMRNRIPESIRTRVEKWGFPVPAKDWFASDFSEQVQDLLESQQVRERGIYKLDRIRKDYASHQKGLIDISDKLFNVIQLELWSKLQDSHRPPTALSTAWQVAETDTPVREPVPDAIPLP
jgi:asparagine synthase (glutamine-hydrolysing)